MEPVTEKDKIIAANPFPGLRPFKIEESHLFFGREGQSDEVLLKLSKHRFVSVIGPSGSGKSSFIYCGVLPILYGGFLTDASPNWEVVVTRPGAGPVENLAESLLKNNPEYEAADTEEKKIKRTIISTLLRSSSLGLVEAIEQSRQSKDVNYLVLVDQFEELFRFKDSADTNSVNETLAFVNLLIEAINYPDAPIYVAITMRSDFIGDCAQFPDLTRKINDSHYLIPQLTRDQKRRAIEGPVAVGGAEITPRLTQQLLNDLGDNPDQLPILQHALMRTWSYWSHYRDRDEEQLDLKHYEAIGTMREALSMHANEAYDELDDDQKRLCEILFKAITEKRGENFGIRRPTRLSEIAAIAGSTEEALMEVIERFREPGRSLLTPGFGIPLEGRSMVDISHESLMRIWVRLKNWVDDEAEAVQMYLRLAEASAMYQVGKAGLWRPPDLQLALNWLAKHKPTLIWGQRYHPAFERTMIFLEYSRKEWETEQRIKELEQKRKLQRARITALVLASATVISLIFLVFAFVQKTEADHQRDLADQQRVLAEENAAEAKKQQRNAEVQRAAAITAQKQAEVAQKLAEDNAEEAKRQQTIAEEQRQLAVRNEQRATDNAAEANHQKGIAQENEQKAKEAEADATRRRYIAQAKAIAIKSKELGDSDPALEALLAQQAFNFNTQYAGYEYDNDIYNGLYNGIKNLYFTNSKKDHPLVASVAGHKKAARALVARKSTNSIYSGGADGRIVRWTFNKGALVADTLVKARDTYLVFSMDISPDENFLVVGGSYPTDRQHNFAELYDLRNPSTPKKITGFVGDISSILFAADNKGFYAVDNAGNSVKYSDLTTAREVVGSNEKIASIDISPDGSTLVGSGRNGNLYLWDVKNGFAEQKIPVDAAGKGTALTAVSYDPAGRTIFVGTQTGIIHLIENGKVVRDLSGHTSSIEQIRFNFAGTFMATASRDKDVRLWKTDFSEQPIVLSAHDWVWSLAFTPDDQQLIAGINSVQQTADRVEQTIRAWPTNIATISGMLCGMLKRNMSQEEWGIYLGDITYESTCSNLPPGNQ